MAKKVLVHAVGRSEVEPLEMPERFRLEVVYFMTPGDHAGAPALNTHEYWIESANIDRWLEEGGFSVVSPLDAETVAEIDLSEDQERWLEWMKKNNLTQIRVVAE